MKAKLSEMIARTTLSPSFPDSDTPSDLDPSWCRENSRSTYTADPFCFGPVLAVQRVLFHCGRKNDGAAMPTAPYGEVVAVGAWWSRFRQTRPLPMQSVRGGRDPSGGATPCVRGRAGAQLGESRSAPEAKRSAAQVISVGCSGPWRPACGWRSLATVGEPRCCCGSIAGTRRSRASPALRLGEETRAASRRRWWHRTRAEPGV